MTIECNIDGEICGKKTVGKLYLDVDDNNHVYDIIFLGQIGEWETGIMGFPLDGIVDRMIEIAKRNGW